MIENVMLITLDCFRRDRLGCYGATSGLTPNIDGVAERGLVFNTAFTVASATDPSHASMLTGVYPNVHGVLGQALELSTPLPTVPEVLRDRGWQTMGAVSVEHLSSYFSFDRGFGTYFNNSRWDLLFAKTKGLSFRGKRLLPLLRYKLPIPNTHWRRGVQTNELVLNWLRKNGRSPFFAWVHYFDAHYYGDAHNSDGRNQERYDAKIRHVDGLVGEVLQTLEDLHIADRTALILLADHGETLGEKAFRPRSGAKSRVTHGHGRSLHNRELRIPMVIGPLPEVGETVYVDGMVTVLDLAPTIYQLLGVEYDKQTHLQGQSLLPLRNTPTKGTTDRVFAITVRELTDKRGVIGPRYKLIRDYDEDQSWMYDWREDPEETHDLKDLYADRAAELESELSYWWAQGHTGYSREENEAIEDMLRSLGYLD
jgi:arylsulfatase A-like enzyme